MNATRIDPAALSIDDAKAWRDSELQRLEVARIVAGLAKGKAKRLALSAVQLHHANILTLSDRIDGPMPDDVAAMSDDELMSALSA